MSGSYLYSQNTWPQRSDRVYQGCIINVEGNSIDYLQNLRPPNVTLIFDPAKELSQVRFESEYFMNPVEEDSLTFIISVTFPDSDSVINSFYQMDIEGLESFNWRSIDEFSAGPLINKTSTLYFIEAQHDEIESGQYGYIFLNVATQYLPADGRLLFTVTHDNQRNDSGMHFHQDSIHQDLRAWCIPALKNMPDGSQMQPLFIEWYHLDEEQETSLFMNESFLGKMTTKPGKQFFRTEITPVTSDTTHLIKLFHGRRLVDSVWVHIRPVQPFEVHLLPHSHVDIGFTHVQEEVIQMQWESLQEAIELGKLTSDYPEEAQFKWNVEVLWAVESYLQKASEQEKQSFIQAVHEGTIGLDALYAGMLTGIQKPEEMMWNTFAAHKLRDEFGIEIQSAMVTDIPGAQWGFIPSLYHNGVKYLNMGPNHMPHMPDLGYQVGHTIKTWGDKPFYWESISGKEKILVWMSSHGYSWFHPWLLGNIRKKDGVPILKFLAELQAESYPYDMVQLRYTLGDNAGPDKDLSAYVQSWNNEYATPKLVINTNQAMFEEFERKYGDKLPIYRGDFTPYWEDGVASSAAETALNRRTAEKIIQAEWLFANEGLKSYPVDEFEEAWRQILLFSEHTWGSYTSKSDPDGQLARDQWAVKQGFALRAAEIVDSLTQSRLNIDLLSTQKTKSIEVINTHPFPIDDLVRLQGPKDIDYISVLNDKGEKLTVQPLSVGSLLIHTGQLPGWSSTTLAMITDSEPLNVTPILPDGFRLNCDTWQMQFDENGNVSSLMTDRGKSMIPADDTLGFNRFWYSGIDTVNWAGASPRSVEWQEYGPLWQQIKVKWDAPGCDSIVSYLACNKVSNAMDIENLVYKQKILNDENARFTFPFDIQDPKITMDHQFGIMRPGMDQIPGSNVNFFCAQRWVFIDDDEDGILWLSKDAPILEYGQPHGQRWASDLKKRPWLTDFQPSATLFSWIMNNVWFVNYKGYQEGLIPFRYRIFPSIKKDLNDMDRKGLMYHQPLLISHPAINRTAIEFPIELQGDESIRLSAIRPSRDQKAWMIRLFNTSHAPASCDLSTTNKEYKLFLSDGTETRHILLDKKNIQFAPWEIITIILEK